MVNVGISLGLVNERNKNKRTPLMVAVNSGNDSIVSKLVEAGAMIDMQDE